jgi:hypothetical protein
VHEPTGLEQLPVTPPEPESLPLLVPLEELAPEELLLPELEVPELLLPVLLEPVAPDPLPPPLVDPLLVPLDVVDGEPPPELLV